jgi:hypothetical protein
MTLWFLALIATIAWADEPVPVDEPTVETHDAPADEPTVRLPDDARREPTVDVVHLTDGQTLEGDVLAQDEVEVVLRLSDGQTLSLPRSTVARITQRTAAHGTRGQYGIDPNRGRYFYSPAAYPLGQGNVTLAQRALVLTTAAVGILPGVDLEVGTILPTLFTREARVGIIGGKGAIRITDKVRIGAGAQGLLVSQSFGGFAFGTVTWGEPDLHVSLNMGAAMDFLNPEASAGVATVSVSRRFNKRIAFVSETWLLYLRGGDGPWGIPFFAIPSGGVRIFGTGFSVDLALVPLIVAERSVPVIPLPWISFVGNLRTRPQDREPR